MVAWLGGRGGKGRGGGAASKDAGLPPEAFIGGPPEAFIGGLHLRPPIEGRGLPAGCCLVGRRGGQGTVNVRLAGSASSRPSPSTTFITPLSRLAPLAPLRPRQWIDEERKFVLTRKRHIVQGPAKFWPGTWDPKRSMAARLLGPREVTSVLCGEGGAGRGRGADYLLVSRWLSPLGRLTNLPFLFWPGTTLHGGSLRGKEVGECEHTDTYAFWCQRTISFVPTHIHVHIFPRHPSRSFENELRSFFKVNGVREHMVSCLFPQRKLNENISCKIDAETEPACRKLRLLSDCDALKAEAAAVLRSLESCGLYLGRLTPEEAAREAKAAAEREAERPRPDRGPQEATSSGGSGARKERAAADAPSRPTLDLSKVAERRAAAQQPELAATAIAEGNVRIRDVGRPPRGRLLDRVCCFRIVFVSLIYRGAGNATFMSV